MRTDPYAPLSFTPQVKDDMTKTEKMFHASWPHMAVDRRWPLNGVINLICEGSGQTVEDEVTAELGRIPRLVAARTQ